MAIVPCRLTKRWSGRTETSRRLHAQTPRLLGAPLNLVVRRHVIRLAAPTDALSIARVHVRSWQAIYRGHFPDDYLANLSADQRAVNWARLLADPSQTIAVYELSGIVGFVCIGPSRDADAGPETGELSSIYLDPASIELISESMIDWG